MSSQLFSTLRPCVTFKSSLVLLLADGFASVFFLISLHMLLISWYYVYIFFFTYTSTATLTQIKMVIYLPTYCNKPLFRSRNFYTKTDIFINILVAVFCVVTVNGDGGFLTSHDSKAP